MPEEILAIVIVAIVMGTVTSMTRMILSYKEKTSGVTRTKDQAGTSMTSSELERMLHRAVRKATDPLIDRLENLEERLDAPAALPERSGVVELEDEVPSSTREPAMATRRRSR